MAKLKAEIRVRCHTCADEYDVAICVGNKALFEAIHGWWEIKPYAIRAAQKAAERTGILYNDKIINVTGC